MRLDKFLAHNGFGTRKQVRQLIKEGAVFVNDIVTFDHGTLLKLETDEIRVHDDIIDYVQNTYIMLNKPQDYICSTESDQYPSVLELIDSYRNDLIIVGRLDVDTEGLLLITNDGHFSHQISHGKKEVFKTYYVKLLKPFNPKFTMEIEQGIHLSDGKAKAAKIRLIDEFTLELSISEGKFHQVKRMMHACDNEVEYLKRIQIGNLKLDENLTPGSYRELTQSEIDTII